MNTNEHIAYLWKICGIVNMIVEYIVKNGNYLRRPLPV